MDARGFETASRNVVPPKAERETFDSEGEADFQLFVLQWRDGFGLDEGLVGCDALAPGRNCALAVVTFQVLPVGNDEVSVPLVKIVDAHLMEQLHAEAGGPVFVFVKGLHEDFAVRRILERAQLICDRRGDPLDAVSKEVQENEALHLEIHVWVDGEAQAVENAGTGRFEVTIFDGEAIFDDFRGDPYPDIDQGLRGHRANQAVTDQFMPRDLAWVLLSDGNFGFHNKAER